MWLFAIDSMDCTLPGSSVHGILQARILEWAAMPSSRGSSRPRNWTWVSMSPALAGKFFTTSATSESLYWILLFFSHSVMSVQKAKATHSSTLAWRTPRIEEPGGLQSMGPLRVGHDWVTSLSLFTFMHWRRKWQPTPVFLPGESQGQRNLLGFCLWGRTESDTTDAT